MFTFLLVASVLVAFAYRVTTPEERQRAFSTLGPAIDVVVRYRAEAEPFRASLRARTPRVIVTPALVVINVVLFARLLIADSTLGESTLLAWGAAQGTRTTDGEWWRLVAATFVHGGMVALAVTLLTLGQFGALVERLVGSVTIGCAFVAAGALGAAVMMSADVTHVASGGSAAVCGLLGVLSATVVWDLLRQRTLTIPLAQFTLLAPAAGVFILWNLAAYGLEQAHNAAGFAAGVIIGLAGALKANHAKVTFTPVAMATSLALLAVVVVSVPVRGLTDVRQQLAQLVAIEDGTADAYRRALRRFTDMKQRVDPKVLTQVIDDAIVPELSRAATGIDALQGVAPEQQPLVLSAREYLRLREASWRLRSEGLRKGSIKLLQQADKMEQSSIEALRPLKDLRSEPSN